MRDRRSEWLCVGWGFTCALFWGSFFDHYERLRDGVVVEPIEQQLTLVIGIMLGDALFGLGVTMLGLRYTDRRGCGITRPQAAIHCAAAWSTDREQ